MPTTQTPSKATTYSKRLNTTGGLAPAAGRDAEHGGTIAPVCHTAGYFFYQAA